MAEAEVGTEPHWQWVQQPLGDPVPIVGSVPHGGREYPPALAGDLAFSPDRLWSDWLTRELYAFLPELGITTVSTPLSRFVADVNRDPAGDLHGGFWDSVVTAWTPRGQPVYTRPLGHDEIRHRVGLAHTPFHLALDRVIGELTETFGRVLLLDLHSFGVHLDTDVVLGDRNGTTARPAAVDRVEGAFEGSGFRVRRNARFIGGWTVRRFREDERVEAIQIELHQSCYLDWAGPRSGPPEPGPSFGPAQLRLRSVLAELATSF